MADLIPLGGRSITPAPMSSDFRPKQAEYSETTDAEIVTLRDILVIFRRHVWIVLGCVILTLGFTAYFVLRQKPQYRATAVIRLLDERKALTGGIEGAAIEQMMGRSNDPLLSQLQVLKSRGVAAEVVDQLGLRLRPLTSDFSRAYLSGIRVVDTTKADTVMLRFGEAGVIVANGPSGDPVQYGDTVFVPGAQFVISARPPVPEAWLWVDSKDNTIAWLQANLRVAPRERTDVVDVEFVATNPSLAQRIVNSLADEFRSMNTRDAQQQSRRRRVFIEEQLQQTDSTLTLAQLALTEFQRREEVFSSQQKFSAQQASMMQLDMRREELDADRRMLETVLKNLEKNKQQAGGLRLLVSSPGVAENPVIIRLYEQLVRYETSFDSLTTGKWASAATNPDVKRFQSLTESTRQKLIEAIRSHIDGLEARVKALVGLKERNVAELQALPATGAEEVRLVQRVETIRKMADQLREEYQKARISEAVEAGQVEIVDQAVLPTKPIGSGRGLKLVLGLIFGLIIGGALAFLVEHLNTSIRRKEDLESALRVPGLAVIPQILTPVSVRHRLGRFAPMFGNGKNGSNSNGSHPVIQSNGSRGLGAELVTVSDLRAPGSEAYRTLRTNLIFSQAVQTMRTLVVTSSGPSEGKTTTAANLAVTFAQQGMKVVIVDCDLRKPRQQEVFNLNREPGLTQWMLGFNTLAEVIQESGVKGLHVIASGTIPPNPSDLLSGERMRAAVAELEREYELVILDTCPLLVASDAAVLGTYAHGVLIVVRAGHTDRGAASQAVQQLRTVGARIIGAVLNDPDSKLETYGGYYYYTKYYGAEA